MISKEIMPYLLEMEPIIDKIVATMDIFQTMNVSTIVDPQSVNILAVDAFLNADKLKALYYQLYEVAKNRDLQATA